MVKYFIYIICFVFIACNKSLKYYKKHRKQLTIQTIEYYIDSQNKDSKLAYYLVNKVFCRDTSLKYVVLPKHVYRLGGYSNYDNVSWDDSVIDTFTINKDDFDANLNITIIDYLDTVPSFQHNNKTVTINHFSPLLATEQDNLYELHNSIYSIDDPKNQLLKREEGITVGLFHLIITFYIKQNKIELKNIEQVHLDVMLFYGIPTQFVF